MDKKSKTIKIIIFIIILLIVSSGFFSLIYLNKIKEKDISETLPQVERIVLENISYEMIDNNVYNIYDSTDTHITTVYSNEELEFYIQNPDYRPSYNDGEDEKIYEWFEEVY